MSLFHSCDKSQNSLAESKLTDEALIMKSFKGLNDSLLNSSYYISTRGFWNNFKRALIVSAADVGGAGAGIAATKEIVGLFGAVSGGTGAAVACGVIGVVCGAGASIAAAESMNYYDYSAPIKTPEVIDAYNKIKESPITFIKLNFPDQYKYLNLIGGIHNSILNYKKINIISAITPASITRSVVASNELDNGDLNAIDEINTEEFKRLESSILNSEEFNDICTNTINVVEDSYVSNGTFNTNFFFNNVNGKLTDKERILQDLYLQIFCEYPNNINDVIFIANEYIRKIEQINIFTESEKENLFLSLSVSVNSAYYWNK